MKIKYFAFSVLLASAAHAQESLGETQSIRCSALSYIHTVIATPPPFNEAMTSMALVFSQAYAAFRTVRTGATMTNGEVSARRSTVEAEFRRTWKAKPEILVREMALCNTWRAQYALRFAAAKFDSTSPEALIGVIGIPPSNPAVGEEEKWRPVVNMAFEAWEEAGLKTGQEARAEFKEQLMKSPKN
jgi:hypothetical protein